MPFLTITDETARTVFADERELTNFTLIDLESFRQGMYYLQLSNGTLEYSGKFMPV